MAVIFTPCKNKMIFIASYLEQYFVANCQIGIPPTTFIGKGSLALPKRMNFRKIMLRIFYKAVQP